MVVITTRSEKTAEVVLGKANHSRRYLLKGLSDDDSWHLFVLTAFERESNEAHDPELTMIDKKIVDKCSNVPLAITVLGTLLYGQTHRWESFEKNRLPQIEITKNPIMSILKLSYNNLEPSVKNCFKYCALFRKDFRMDKQKLIGLWMAQGYMGDSEDYFLILLKRCFFQDVEKDELGDVVSCKMHDLIHDLAQEVAGDEIIVANSPPNNLSKSVRHIFLDGGDWTNGSLGKGNIRTCYMDISFHPDLARTLASNWCCLRSLRLYVPDAEGLPESIGELLHLRYLDLSKNENLKTLPNSITKLYNLQSLIIFGCLSLKEWPKYFYKLVNLRLLDMGWCSELRGMPMGIGQLVNLCELTEFRVGGGSSIDKQFGGEMEDLKHLVNLRGKIIIMIYENRAASEKENVWGDGYLEHIKDLKVVWLYFFCKAHETNCEPMIAKLQPNRNLMELILYGYNGTEIPRWGRTEDDWAFILPHLVKIELSNCEMLHGILSLSNLRNLKSLSLISLNNLEYMEPCASSRGNSSSASKNFPFFPSLENLNIYRLDRLKGWWPGVISSEGDSSGGGISMLHWQPPFPHLSRLIIDSCPELTSFPPCPSLESLTVSNSNKALQILPGEGEGPANLNLKLRVEKIGSLGYLTTLPATRLTSIAIVYDGQSKSLSEIEEVFRRSSSLRKIKLKSCRNLTSISQVFKHLIALEVLILNDIPAVDEQLDDDDMPWRSLRHNLRFLKLEHLYSLQILPTGLKHLTALENLIIKRCYSLKGLPEWISCLSSLHSLTIDYCPNLNSLGTIQNITSLQTLKIRGCPDLTKACEEPSGKEWPNIQHIPHISFWHPEESESDSD